MSRSGASTHSRFPRVERLEGESHELASLVHQQMEAGAVGCPRAGQELHLALVRRQLGRVARRDVDEIERHVAVRAELERDQLRAVGGERRRERVHPFAEDIARLVVAVAPDEHLAVLGAARVGGERERASVRRPGAGTDHVLHLRQVGQLLGPATSRGNPVELVELVAVAVGDEEDRAVLADGDGAHGVLRERRQLVRPAAVNMRGPEVELPRDVRGEENATAVGRELGDRLETAVREELLERGEVGHARSLQRHGINHLRSADARLFSLRPAPQAARRCGMAARAARRRAESPADNQRAVAGVLRAGQRRLRDKRRAAEAIRRRPEHELDRARLHAAEGNDGRLPRRAAGNRAGAGEGVGADSRRARRLVRVNGEPGVCLTGRPHDVRGRLRAVQAEPRLRRRERRDQAAARGAPEEAPGGIDGARNRIRRAR